MMGKTRCFALLSLALAVASSEATALAQPAAEGEPKNAAEEAAPGGETGSPAEKLQKRKERLGQAAQRLRERAAELRKRAAAGEQPKAPANSSKPPRSFEEQAQKFEAQAAKMEERAKNLTEEDVAERPQRFTGNARERRHQIRKANINRRWGAATLRNPDAIAELKLHAERTARLKRIRSLAMKKSKDDPMAKRATDLMAKEDERHEKAMKAIQEKSGGAPQNGNPTPAGETK